MAAEFAIWYYTNNQDVDPGIGENALKVVDELINLEYE